MLPLYNILKINYWHHRIHLRKVLTNSLFNSKPDTLYLSKHRLCCPAEIIEHSHLLPIVDLSGVLCVCAFVCVGMCLHVYLNLFFRSTYIQHPSMNCGHQQKQPFIVLPWLPADILCEWKWHLWLRTLLCRCVGVFVAKMMDYTGNGRKGPFRNNGLFIRKQWLQMLDWLICMMDESMFGLGYSFHFSLFTCTLISCHCSAYRRGPSPNCIM